MKRAEKLWLISGLRTPFVKVDGALQQKDVLDLSILVVKAMINRVPFSP